jgi:hypothetical protein
MDRYDLFARVLRAPWLWLAVGVFVSAGPAAAQISGEVPGYDQPGAPDDGLTVGPEAVPVSPQPARDSLRLGAPCSADPDDPWRHRGRGVPLQGTSWLHRPLYAGWFAGGLFGDALNDQYVDQQSGLFGGYHLGRDFDHYWAAEGRFGFANVDISDDQTPQRPRTVRDWLWDADVLYYPWGDSHWRPFVSLGVGVASFRFDDQNGQRINSVLFQLPFGIGLKYYFQKCLALRFSAMDNLAFGHGELDTMHNFSVTAGVEAHWGGRPTSYYPWNPSIHLW